MLLCLRTVIHPAPNLDASKALFTGLLGQPPYFDHPFCVGLHVAGNAGDIGDGIRAATVREPGPCR